MAETTEIIEEMRESGLSDNQIYQFAVTRSTEYFGIPEHSDGYRKWVAIMHHFEAEMRVAQQKKEMNRAKRAEYAREYRNLMKEAARVCKGRSYGWYWKFFSSREEFEAFKTLPKVQQWHLLIKFAKLE